MDWLYSIFCIFLSCIIVLYGSILFGDLLGLGLGVMLGIFVFCCTILVVIVGVVCVHWLVWHLFTFMAIHLHKL